ncbi:membrane-spanning 4-domains subfamily A member 12-like isoform X2 [Alexandromys fortis]|uniref:membrane-spanning 4-domains subfamily A member 12-like isoform X2 n=1 Tax=Alexandromys fortis TaxID=100897 RepID=UPI0021524899|nr:membrane-spanning 4-domains subfamily A member 12-like isoform X2 [Microtus fortis]
MTSSQTTTYPGMHVAIPNPYPPTSSMALHPQPPLGFLNTGNQVQTGQLSYITSPGILTTHQLSLENVPTGHPAPGTTTNPKFKDAAMALGFIASGSLSVLAFKKPSPSLLKSTLAMNIISVIFASVGVILFVWDLNINGYYYQNYWMVLSGKGIVGILAIFSMSEVSIACVMVYFAYQTLLHRKRSALAVPSVHVANPLTQQPFPDPAIYERVPAYAPQPYQA